MKLTIQIISSLSDKYSDIDIAGFYGEPGYDSHKDWILFANWNYFPVKIVNWLSKKAELEWCDEWLIDRETDKAYRCSPDSYSWTPYYIMTEDGDIIGGDRIEDGSMTDEYIKLLINNPAICNLFDIDLAEQGFELVNDHHYETGFYGRKEDPKEILAALQVKYPDMDFIFSDLNKSQFATRWNIYRRKKQVEQ